MPKKTNKTNHVLNLLVNGNQVKSAASPSEVLQSAPQPITGSQITVPQASASPAAIRIVESDQDINHPIADAIKVSLEQEVALMGIQPKSPASPQEEESSEKIVPDKELDYQFVNVMEITVKENLLDYMERFGLCTCLRCQADVMALALTRLPAKYIVVPQNAVSPLLNFFSGKYKVSIMTELTKACFQILDNPRH